MYRNILNDFNTWFDEQRRRILFVKGAHGVGKTWAVKDFATAYFDVQIYIDLKTESCFDELFLSDSEFSTEEKNQKMLELLHSKCGDSDINRTIFIFDNLTNTDGLDQFFHEFTRKNRAYCICLIESSMHITEYEFHHKDVFNILRMRPMTFEEFMIAKKATPLLAAIESSKNKPLSSMEEASLQNMLKEYMMIGGLPEIVNYFLSSKDLEGVRKLQLQYIASYENIIKESNTSAMSQRMRRIWRSIPKQLTHDNKKFMYRFVEENARSREYSEAVQMLCDLGFVRKLPRLKDASIPLEEHADYKSFELFLIDHGLLRAIYEEPVSDSLTLNDIMQEQNGAVAEQYLFEELSNKVVFLYYWISGATARVPFVYDGDSLPVPVEIRFTENKKAQNIRTFRSKYPDTDISIKVSLSQVYLENKVLNIPAYGLWNM